MYIFHRIALICVVTHITGCEILPAHPKSNDLQGERVVITMKGKSSTPITQKASLAQAIPALGAAELAGVAIDFIQKQIAAEVERYERQFGTVLHKGAFWEKNASGDWEALYSGFIIQRFTDRNAAIPAFELDCDFESAGDSRIIKIIPKKLVVNSSKCKVPWIDLFGNAKITVRVNTMIEAAWIQAGKFTSAQVASVDWSWSGHLLGSTETSFSANDVAGWFLAPPPGDPSGSQTSGAFKLAVAVTERDESEARQYLERVSKLIDAQREK